MFKAQRSDDFRIELIKRHTDALDDRRMRIGERSNNALKKKKKNLVSLGGRGRVPPATIMRIT